MSYIQVYKTISAIAPLLWACSWPYSYLHLAQPTVPFHALTYITRDEATTWWALLIDAGSYVVVCVVFVVIFVLCWCVGVLLHLLAMCLLSPVGSIFGFVGGTLHLFAMYLFTCMGSLFGRGIQAAEDGDDCDEATSAEAAAAAVALASRNGDAECSPVLLIVLAQVVDLLVDLRDQQRKHDEVGGWSEKDREQILETA